MTLLSNNRNDHLLVAQLSLCSVASQTAYSASLNISDRLIRHGSQCSGKAEDKLQMIFECAVYHELCCRSTVGVTIGGLDMLTLFCSPSHQLLSADGMLVLTIKRDQLVNVIN